MVQSATGESTRPAIFLEFVQRLTFHQNRFGAVVDRDLFQQLVRELISVRISF